MVIPKDDLEGLPISLTRNALSPLHTYFIRRETNLLSSNIDVKAEIGNDSGSGGMWHDNCSRNTANIEDHVKHG